MSSPDQIPNFLPQIIRKGSPKSNKYLKWIFFSTEHKADIILEFKKKVAKETLAEFQKGNWVVWNIQDKGGQRVLLVSAPAVAAKSSHFGLLEESSFTYWKQQGGALYQKEFLSRTSHIEVDVQKLSSLELLGFLIGIELSCYQYLKIHNPRKSVAKEQSELPILHFGRENQNLTPDLILEAQSWAFGQNLSRHLVNLPPGECYPEVIVDYVRKYFKGLPGVTLKVLNLAQIKQEKMGLLLGVGQGSTHEPRFLQIHYRSDSKKRSPKTVALVGKGVTFDTGGLDIKPSSGMRLMKKDMAGAAAVIGSMFYASQARLPLDVSAYLPLAENSVDAKSMRPSDVLTSRNGLTVEIHNTDAEGRLILADALDFAVTHSPKPDLIIDVATLTGAIKTTLGLEISGLFSNDDDLAHQLQKASHQAGDLTWRIPLFSKYTASFASPFADLVNSVDGWAGPITAALFLEKFVGNIPWAHFDIYGWQDKPSGTQVHAGGNGQGVGLLNAFLKQLASKNN